MQSTEDLKKIASQVRRDIIRMVVKANSGHPGGSMSSADFMTALYFNVMDMIRRHGRAKGRIRTCSSCRPDISPQCITQSFRGQDISRPPSSARSVSSEAAFKDTLQ